MVKHVKSKAYKKLESQAKLVAAEIASLMNEYTHDSAEAKFYLPTEVSDPILITAGSFASQLYSLAAVEDLNNTAAFSMFYLAITYGFQVYLKELSIKTGGAPYQYPTDSVFIEAARMRIYDLAQKKELITTDLCDLVFEIFLSNLRKNYLESEFEYGGLEFDEELFFAYLGVSLYWGYNFAKEVVVSE